MKNKTQKILKQIDKENKEENLEPTSPLEIYLDFIKRAKEEKSVIVVTDYEGPNTYYLPSKFEKLYDREWGRFYRGVLLEKSSFYLISEYEYRKILTSEIQKATEKLEFFERDSENEWK